MAQQEQRTLAWSGGKRGLFALLALVVGCACPGRPQIEDGLRPQTAPGAATRQYTLACPDVVQVQIHGGPALAAAVVEPDGCIALGAFGRVRIEGLPTTEAAERIATQADCCVNRVQVQVVAYRSRLVFLHGGTDAPRPIDYRGPETVVELLRRAGGLDPGAAVDEVHVVRPHVAEGLTPEVFAIQLRAILDRHDSRTNIVLQPFDEIYVGELARARVARVVAPWLQPAFRAAWGLTPTPTTTAKK
jgi:polysaccharide export outer membrane protein